MLEIMFPLLCAIGSRSGTELHKKWVRKVPIGERFVHEQSWLIVQ